MNNGLTNRDIETMRDLFSKHPNVKLVHIFGSRAKGTFLPGSDVDLAIMKGNVEYTDLLRLKSELDESSLPYIVDVVYYPTLKHKELKEHIDRVGVPIYRRS